ncbi:MAG: hypothetical protein H0U57_09205 [Tatlockia sp.]|nr:hypothetical protein [Tatlockia sp.]
MQRRDEFNQIVGYGSRFSLIASHIQTAIPSAFTAMEVCRYLFGWLANPYNDFYLREIAILSAVHLIVHVNNNYGLESLITMRNEARQLINLQPRVRQMELCLFSSPESAYRSHHKTIIESMITGAVSLKTYQLLTEGILLYNLPYIGLGFFLLVLLTHDLTQAVEQNFDADSYNVTIQGP